MATRWSNWSGSLQFTPDRMATPRDEAALAHLVQECATAGTTVRVVGAGHSSSPLVDTDGTLVSLKHLNTLISHNAAACQALIGAGMTIDAAGKTLQPLGMAFENLGDVDYQTVAGAFGTGTHGTVVNLPALPLHLIGGRLVTGTGEIIDIHDDERAALIPALRVSLGALGIFSALRLRLAPAQQMRRRVWCTRIDDCLDHFPELAAMYRHVDFYWYPRSDEAKIRITDVVERDQDDLPYGSLVEETVGWNHEILPTSRELRFEEMEYGLPAEAGLACFQRVRQRVKDRWRASVGWRVLYRTVAADDTWLSIAYGRPTATISLHQNASLPYKDYFADIEPLFREVDGRPHWGKKHNLQAAELRPLYPEWDRFLETRQRLDPDGTFLNAYLRDLLGVP